MKILITHNSRIANAKMTSEMIADTLKGKCVSEGHPGELTVYCLEDMFK